MHTLQVLEKKLGYTFRCKKVEKPMMHWKFVVYLSIQPPKTHAGGYAELAEKALAGG